MLSVLDTTDTIPKQSCAMFRSKGYAPNWTLGGEGDHRVQMGSLPPFLRTLLVTDGTVTKSLEAYFWEPVGIDTLFQKSSRTDKVIDWLSVSRGEEVLERHVDIMGYNTKNIYARAYSVVRVAPIPTELRVKLVMGELGIGELIRDCGLETYRELLEIGVEGARQGMQSDFSDDVFVYRTYRIMIQREPSILVTERFPVELYRVNG